MKWIDEIVLGLLDAYGTNDPEELCDVMGIDVVQLDEGSPILREENSIYIREYGEKEIIFIRESLQPDLKSFYLRHELGHAILHPDLKCSYRGGLINFPKLEKHANYFAFKLSGYDLEQIEIEGMNISQVASYVRAPEDVLYEVIGR